MTIIVVCHRKLKYLVHFYDYFAECKIGVK